MDFFVNIFYTRIFAINTFLLNLQRQNKPESVVLKKDKPFVYGLLRTLKARRQVHKYPVFIVADGFFC